MGAQAVATASMGNDSQVQSFAAVRGRERMAKVCEFCQKPVRGRKDKRFCSDKCRFDGWARRGDVLPCTYCGLPGQGIDHIPPQSIRPILLELGFGFRYPFLEVPSCHECNELLGTRAIWQLPSRKRFIKATLRRRYKKLLAMPEWSLEEIKELGPNCSTFVLQSALRRRTLIDRLKW